MCPLHGRQRWCWVPGKLPAGFAQNPSSPGLPRQPSPRPLGRSPGPARRHAPGETLLEWLLAKIKEHQEQIDGAWRVVLGDAVYDLINGDKE